MEENTLEKILTPQEHILLGSGTLLEESGKAEVNLYKPEAVSDGTTSLRSVVEMRKKMGWFEGSMLSVLLGVPHIGIRLVELDPETGETLTDPIVGVLDEGKGEYVPRQDLTNILFNRLKEAGIDPHLREKGSSIEGKVSEGENKG